MNQAEALYQVGFTITESWDISQGYPGIHQLFPFDPTKPDPQGRYGVPSLSALRYDPNNYTGAHASGLNSFAMDNLAAVLSDAVKQPVTLDEHALADMDMLRGATQWALSRALAMGLLAPAAPKLPPVDPPSASGDVAKDLQIATLTGKVNAVRKIAQKALDALPSRGGGQWVNADRATFPAILQALAPVLLLCFLVLASGCAANRAVRTAAVGQGVAVPALLECADVVAKNPAMGPLLSARLDKSQAQVNLGNPLAGIFAFSANDLDPRAQAALVVISGKIDRLMQDALAAIQGAINGCRMGILSVPVKP